MSYVEVGAAKQLQPNVIDRFFTEPSTNDPDVKKARRLMANLVRPLSGAIDVVPGMSRSDKRKFKEDPFKLLFDTVQNGREMFRDLINRVARRSGKSTRSIGGTRVDMTAASGDSPLRTVLQLVILLGTEWFATHDEMVRMSLGQPRGEKGWLGAYSEIGVEPVTTTTAVAAAAPIAEGITIAEATAGLSALGTLTGALKPIIDVVLDLAKKDEKQAKKKAEAAGAPAAPAPLPPGYVVTTPAAAAASSSTPLIIGGLVLAGAVAVLALKK